VGLTAEALAILCAVLGDLNAWGIVRTSTTIDARLPYADLAADRVVLLGPDRHMPTLERLALECNAALVLAPKRNGVLGRITQRLESLDVVLLDASSDSVSIAADKWQCYQLFRENAIPTPETCLVVRDDVINKAAGLNPPWKVKPRDGVGADSCCAGRLPKMATVTGTPSFGKGGTRG
jgi:predicted ATP-grasp superfamily ATP-dependent carboligase